MPKAFTTHIITLVSLAGLSACAVSTFDKNYAVTPIYITDEARVEAPFGGTVSADITNYTRAAPYVATAGKLEGDGVAEALRAGFQLIIDLRRPDEEGVTEEMVEAMRLGIDYQNVPLAKDETAWEQVDQVTQLLSDPANYPVLLHCASANRAGAVWSLYRAQQGVPALIAIEEGRALGLKSREEQVRRLLSVPET